MNPHNVPSPSRHTKREHTSKSTHKASGSFDSVDPSDLNRAGLLLISWSSSARSREGRRHFLGSAVMSKGAAAFALVCLAVMAAVADGALLPWFGDGRRGRDEAAAAAVSPLSDLALLADPFRILEHVPFGFDRDDVAMVSLARVDWRETPDAHEIAVDVPGMRKEDLKIEVEDNRVLRVSGERRRAEEHRGDHWHREERSYGRFWRQFRLPENADLDSVAASLDNGVLSVRFRKLAPEQIKGPRVVGIAGGDSDGDAKKSIGAGAGEEHRAKKVEL